MDAPSMAWRIQQMQAEDKRLDSMSAEELHALWEETKPAARNLWLGFPVGEIPHGYPR
jgi:hypothetical protein